MSLASNLSPVSVGRGVSTIAVGSIGVVGGVGEGGGVERGTVSLGLPLAQGVLDNGAGADSEGATIRVLLGVQGGGAEKSGDLMYSSLEITIISSNSLVTSNGNRHSGSGGDNLGLEGQGLDGGNGVCVGVGSVGVGGVGEASGVDKGGVSLGLPLAVVGEGGDHGASAGAEAHVSAALLLLDSEGGHQPGDFVHGPGQVAVGAGHGLVASDRDGDRVTSDHGGGGSKAIAKVLGSGGGEAAGGCQQQERTHFPDCSSAK